MNEYAILSIHGSIILIGVILMTPFGDVLGGFLVNKWPSTATKRGRMLAGLMMVCTGGFTVSAQTLWMHNKLSEGGSVCSGSELLNCDGLIGNPDYNTVPFIGQPWGLLGMVAFCLLLWLAITVAKEPLALSTQTFLKAGLGATIAGLPVIGLLVSYEIKEGLICPFCTAAHIANVIAMVGFILLLRMYESEEWAPELKKTRK
ncbi:MAG: vitamin K epoxide reductase family protein [Candidatus Poseidoniaceae archaeon]